MKTKNLLPLLSVMVVLLFASCKKDPITPNEIHGSGSNTVTPVDTTKKLPHFDVQVLPGQVYQRDSAVFFPSFGDSTTVVVIFNKDTIFVERKDLVIKFGQWTLSIGPLTKDTKFNFYTCKSNTRAPLDFRQSIDVKVLPWDDPRDSLFIGDGVHGWRIVSRESGGIFYQIDQAELDARTWWLANHHSLAFYKGQYDMSTVTWWFKGDTLIYKNDDGTIWQHSNLSKIEILNSNTLVWSHLDATNTALVRETYTRDN